MHIKLSDLPNIKLKNYFIAISYNQKIMFRYEQSICIAIYAS